MSAMSSRTRVRTACTSAPRVAVMVCGTACPQPRRAGRSGRSSLIVPFPAGGGTDAFARPLAAQLEIQLKQRFLIDNRGGAGGTIGASAAAKAEPNGYTFLVGAAHHTIAPSLYPKLDYDIEKDFIPVGVIAMPPQVIVVNPAKVQAKTLAEFIAYAKANPEQDQLRVGRHGHDASARGRAVQDPDQHRTEPRALSRRRSGDAGPRRRACGCDVRRPRLLGQPDPERHAARPRGGGAGAFVGDPRCADQSPRPG